MLTCPWAARLWQSASCPAAAAWQPANVQRRMRTLAMGVLDCCSSLAALS